MKSSKRVLRMFGGAVAISSLVGCGLIVGFGDDPALGDAGQTGDDAGFDTSVPTGDTGPHNDGNAPPVDGQAGEGAAGCVAPQIACGTTCTTTATDAQNCGTCGHACAQGFACSGGVCDNAVVTMASGSGHVCAKLKRGDLYCWGNNAEGEVGSGDAGGAIAQPVLIPRDSAQNTIGNIAQLTGGESHACLIKTDGTLLCWGSDVYGQLSDEAVSPDGGPLNRPLPEIAYQKSSPFSGATTYRYQTLALGNEANHGCATTDDASVYCWGNNANNQLHHDAGILFVSANCNGSDCASGPYVVTPLPSVKQVAVGSDFTCAVDKDGGIECWGANFNGELGAGAHGIGGGGIAQPTNVALDGGAAAYVASGATSSCAVMSDGTVRCWGNNVGSQLGHDAAAAPDLCCNVEPGCGGGNYCSAYAGKVDGLADVSTVEVGCKHACALKTDGTVWCWGTNDKGQLGTGDNTSGGMPRKVSSLAGAKGIALGCNHSCAWLDDGTAWCWGLNATDQLANGIANTNVPVAVKGLP